MDNENESDVNEIKEIVDGYLMPRDGEVEFEKDSATAQDEFDGYLREDKYNVDDDQREMIVKQMESKQNPFVSGEAPGYQRPLDLFVRPLYKKQPHETVAEYQQYLAYAKLPPALRTVDNAFKEWNQKKRYKHTTQKFRQNAAHWRWQERALAIDVQKNRVLENRWMVKETQRREDDWDVGGALRDKAMDALEKLDIDDLSPRNITTFLELASKLQQDAIPNMQLSQGGIQALLGSLDDNRRGRILRLFAAEITET